MRWLLLILLLLLIGLQYQLWFRGGMNEVWALEKALDEQRQANEKLKARNAALAAEVEDLKTGRDAVEERARSELGMVEQGEVLIQVATPESTLAKEKTDDEAPR